jgi:3-deoxy-manno-octulosonate cytidylyltransferase (CMP-KDO synthetase)
LKSMNIILCHMAKRVQSGVIFCVLTQKWLDMSDFLILVPARFGSTRFPGKPLAKINNKPMIQYVVENCQKSGFDYAIVTDNDEIEACVKSFSGNVVRVDDDVSTGSERIALAYQRNYSDQGYKYIINVQGDEPLLLGGIIQQIGFAHKESDFDIYTAVKKRSSKEEEFLNSNIVKCIKSDKTNQCLYFSRESIPHSREGIEFDWFQHIGVYSYKVDALNRFVELSPSKLEELEKLEQLRALENGLTIGAEEIKLNLIGVDVPEDIKKIEGVLGE